jgi:hypothetical protein
LNNPIEPRAADEKHQDLSDDSGDDANRDEIGQTTNVGDVEAGHEGATEGKALEQTGTAPNSNGKDEAIQGHIEESTAPAHFVNEYFETRESARGGLGSFARKNLHRDHHILLERPLLRASAMTLLTEFKALSPERQRAFLSLHAYSSDPRAPLVDKIWNANA